MSGWSSTQTASRPTLVVRSSAQHAPSDTSSTVNFSSVMVLIPVRSLQWGHIFSGQHWYECHLPGALPSREAQQQDLRLATAKADEVVGALVRPIRCMATNLGLHTEKDVQGTADHGDTLAEASIRRPRPNVPEWVVQRTHVA